MARLFGLILGLLVVAAVTTPLWRRWPVPWRAGLGMALTGGAALLAGTPAAAAPVAGFLLVLAAPARAFLGGALGLLLLGAPFLLEPYVENRNGELQPVVATLTLWSSPAMGIAGAMGFDWLRYRGVYGRLRLPQYHPYAYPRPWAQGALWGALALAIFFLGPSRRET